MTIEMELSTAQCSRPVFGLDSWQFHGVTCMESLKLRVSLGISLTYVNLGKMFVSASFGWVTNFLKLQWLQKPQCDLS